MGEGSLYDCMLHKQCDQIATLFCNFWTPTTITVHLPSYHSICSRQAVAGYELATFEGKYSTAAHGPKAFNLNIESVCVNRPLVRISKSRVHTGPFNAVSCYISDNQKMKRTSLLLKMYQCECYLKEGQKNGLAYLKIFLSVHFVSNFINQHS